MGFPHVEGVWRGHRVVASAVDVHEPVGAETSPCPQIALVGKRNVLEHDAWIEGDVLASDELPPEECPPARRGKAERSQAQKQLSFSCVFSPQ